jgi:transposase-like protein
VKSKSQSARERYHQILGRRREGELLRDLARRHGVEPRAFYRWRALFKDSAALAEPSASRQLIPVEVAGPTPLDLGALLGASFEVALRESGHLVRVPPGFEAAALSRLVGVLEGP